MDLMEQYLFSLGLASVVEKFLNLITRQFTYGKNKGKEKNSRFFPLSAQGVLHRRKKENIILSSITIGLIVLIFIVLPQAKSLNIIMGGFALIFVIVIVSLFISSYFQVTSDSVLLRDCDTVKWCEMSKIRLQNPPKHNNEKLIENYCMLFLRDVAYCYIITDDKYESEVKNIISNMEARYPEHRSHSCYWATRVRLAIRNNDLKEIENSLKFYSSYSNGDMVTCEAAICSQILRKNYSKAREILVYHLHTRKPVLYYVILHYYMAMIELSEGNASQAQKHLKYIKNNGGTTYYYKDLQKRFNLTDNV